MIFYLFILRFAIRLEFCLTFLPGAQIGAGNDVSQDALTVFQ
jgi:hypothetical protein